MVFASAFMAFDVQTQLWSGPRKNVRLSSCRHVSLKPSGRIVGLSPVVCKQLLLLRATVAQPNLGRRMALRDEYKAYYALSRMPCMRHGDVLLVMDGKGGMTHAVVFYVRGWSIASLDDLTANFTCLSRSFYQGRLSRTLYLSQLRSSGILTRISVSNATEDERAVAVSLLRLSDE